MCTCSKVRDLLGPIIITNFVSHRIVIMMVHARNTGYRPNIGLVSSTLLIVLPLQCGTFGGALCISRIAAAPQRTKLRMST